MSSFGLSHGTHEILVYSNGIKAACSVASGCTYVFSSTITPNISSISPTTVNGSTLMTLTGSNFVSQSSLVNVIIGNQLCSTLTATATQITCQLNGLNLGNQNVLLNIKG